MPWPPYPGSRARRAVLPTDFGKSYRTPVRVSGGSISVRSYMRSGRPVRSYTRDRVPSLGQWTVLALGPKASRYLREYRHLKSIAPGGGSTSRRAAWARRHI